jgi:hypothetical protein
MRLIKIAAWIASALSFPCSCMATIYYVSPTGSDSALGISPLLPWKTVAKVNATKFGNTDQVLFLAGGEWREMLSPTVTGVTYGAYGTGARPIISGANIVTTAWTSAGAHSCSTKVGGSDMTNVWINGVVGAPVASAAAILVPGQWFYSGGTLYLGLSTACNAVPSSTVIEFTARPYALYINKVGSLTISGLEFVDGMYNTIYIGTSVTGTQTFSNVVWKGAGYEGFISNAGAQVITNSEGLYNLTGLAAAGGNGFSLANSILSGNTQDAIEVYGTSGISTIQSSTISGNATADPLYGTINNWSSHALNASNSILLPNPFIPLDYNFVAVTEDGTDVETSPLFTARAAPLIIMPFVDDYNNLSVAQAVSAVAHQYGCTLNYALNTKLVTATDWTSIAALQTAGDEIVAHTRSHSDLANNNVFTIQYVGTAAKTATMTISQAAGTLQTFLNGSTTPDLTVQLLDKYNSTQILCASVAANPNYTCVVQPNQLYFTPLNLANVTNVNIIPGYLEAAAPGYLTWEIQGAQQDIAANIPGYTATSFATPFTSSNLTVEQTIQGFGFLSNRNGTVTANLTPNGNWLFSNMDIFNLASYWLPDQYDPTQPAGSVAALVEGLGAAGGVFAVYSHGYDEFTLAQWTQLFQLLQQDGATCMTMTQARNYIESHGALVPDGTKRFWYQSVPLNPVFSNTLSSPVQGAHGLQ